MCSCTKGTNGSQISTYRDACLSFIISINFLLCKLQKVDSKNKILNFIKWFFRTLSVQGAYQRGLCIKSQAGKERNGESYLFSFYSGWYGQFKVGSWNFQTLTLSSKSFLYLE